MATPRLFISSTCYDLQEVRYQLRNFIGDLGYEPVMSEFGDIFYDYKKHVQDSCKEEIGKCQFFILIIGNHYGSYYHRQKEQLTPDSVTLQELKKALETNIFKHIFINKFVDYDYKNYINALKNYISQNADSKFLDLDESEYDIIINRLKAEFRVKYFYPQESYRFIFNFLDLVYSLESNNAIIPYESFDDIKNSLRKQWASFMYDSILEKNSVPSSFVDKLEKKIDKIEYQLRTLIDNQLKEQKDETKISYDLRKIITSQSLDDFEELRDKIFNLVNKILVEVDDWDNQYHDRLTFLEKVEKDDFIRWIESLDSALLKLKWAKTISINIIFQNLATPYSTRYENEEIPTKIPTEFGVIIKDLKKSLELQEYNNLLDALLIEFNKHYREKVQDFSSINEVEQSDDSLPF